MRFNGRAVMNVIEFAHHHVPRSHAAAPDEARAVSPPTLEELLRQIEDRAALLRFAADNQRRTDSRPMRKCSPASPRCARRSSGSPSGRGISRSHLTSDARVHDCLVDARARLWLSCAASCWRSRRAPARRDVLTRRGSQCLPLLEPRRISLTPLHVGIRISSHVTRDCAALRSRTDGTTATPLG
jgi:hypothetical protein